MLRLLDLTAQEVSEERMKLGGQMFLKQKKEREGSASSSRGTSRNVHSASSNSDGLCSVYNTPVNKCPPLDNKGERFIHAALPNIHTAKSDTKYGKSDISCSGSYATSSSKYSLSKNLQVSHRKTSLHKDLRKANSKLNHLMSIIFGTTKINRGDDSSICQQADLGLGVFIKVDKLIEGDVFVSNCICYIC